ncbi:Rapamycin-insensitive companion of mTOR, N-term-domain-containing protein [Syncephalis fuscata]|nr:Rapamycin-insensitive companion of mTOR, N-term-domain-containing protein [Syncephalis fuscata]
MYDDDSGMDDASDFAMGYYLNSSHDIMPPVLEEDGDHQEKPSIIMMSPLQENADLEARLSTSDRARPQELEVVALFPKSIESAPAPLERPLPHRSTSLPISRESSAGRTKAANNATMASAAVPSVSASTSRISRSKLPEKGPARKQRDEAVRNAMVHVQKIDISDLDLAGKNAREESERVLHKLEHECKGGKERAVLFATLTKLIATMQEHKETVPIDAILKGVRPFLNDRVSELRASALRTVKCAMVNREAIQLLKDLQIDIFVVQSLTRDQRYEWEREQAIKLIRTCLEIPRGAEVIPESILRAMVAIAEQVEDTYRNLCLETICELAVRCVESAVRCGGIRVVLNALLDGHHSLSESLVLTLLYLLDSPQTRHFLRPGVDVEMSISCFTDGFSRGQTAIERMKNSSTTLKHLIRSWPGLLYVCANDMGTVRSVVAALSSPLEETRVTLMGLIRELLDLDNPLNTPPDPRDTHMHMLRQYAFRSRTIRPSFVNRVDLVQHHLSAVLLVFLESGLIEQLCNLITQSNKAIVAQALALLTDVLKLGRQILPSRHAARMQSLPQLVNLAVVFNDNKRALATSALQSINLFVEDDERRRKSYVTYESLNKLSQAVFDATTVVNDDAVFRNALQETRVLTVKDGTKWDWDLIAELFATTLKVPKYLDDALRGAHFMKRLLGFYHPASGFPQLPMTLENMKYIKIGHDILETLLLSSDGQRFLKESELLREIALYLSQMIPTPGADVSVLTRIEVNKTLTWAYIWLLMSLSRTKEGIRALERANVFDTIYCLSQIANREDVYREILTSMSYVHDGFPRAILVKMLTSEATSARWLATCQLRNLVHEKLPNFHEWAVTALDEACEYPGHLEMLVRLCPMLDHLGELGRPLFFRFLASTHGIHHILDMEQISKEMDFWLERNNIEYVAEVEMTLSNAYNVHLQHQQHAADAVLPTDTNVRFERRCHMTKAYGLAPPHLYGSLVQTPAGCELLQRKEHLDVLASTIHGWPDMLEVEENGILKLKAALWAIVWQYWASEQGFTLLNEAIVQDIVYMASASEVLSVRGTCFYVLGLLNKTQIGAELLEELGWLCCTTSYGRSLGVCLPTHPDQFFLVPKWRFTQPSYTIYISLYTSPPDAITKEILTSISNLTNHILANAGSKALSRLKGQHPEKFKDLTLYLEVLGTMERSHFRLSARRFILDLFDVTFDTDALTELDQLTGQLQERRALAFFSKYNSPYEEIGHDNDGIAEFNDDISYTIDGDNDDIDDDNGDDEEKRQARRRVRRSQLATNEDGRIISRAPLVGSPELRQAGTPPSARYNDRRVSSTSSGATQSKQSLEPAVVIRGFII